MRCTVTAGGCRSTGRAALPGVGGVALAALLLVPSTIFAQAVSAAAELKLSVAVGPALPLGKAAQRWGELLRDGGDAAIATKLHPGASLAGRDPARELLALADGRADLAVGSSLQWSMQVPALAVFSLPWIAPQDAQLDALAADAELRALLAARLAESGVTLVTLAPLGYREIATATKPIRAPGDMAGLRLRTAPSPLLQETLLALGARPQTLPLAQAQAAFATGQLDGQEGLPTALAAARALAGGQRHVTDLGGVAEALVFAVRSAVWEAWTPAQQAHARRTAEQAIGETRPLEREHAALRRLAGQGVLLLRLTVAGQQAFRHAATDVAQRWRATVGTKVVERAERVVAIHEVPERVDASGPSAATDATTRPAARP